MEAVGDNSYGSLILHGNPSNNNKSKTHTYYYSASHLNFFLATVLKLIYYCLYQYFMTRVPLVKNYKKKLKQKEERGERAGGVGKGMGINPLAITTSYPSSSVADDKQELAPTYPPHSGKNWNERSSPLPCRASAVIDAALAARRSPLPSRSHPVVAGIQSLPELGLEQQAKPSPLVADPSLLLP